MVTEGSHLARNNLEIQENESAPVSLLSRIGANLKRDLGLLVNYHFMICTFTYISFILDFVAFIIILPDVAKEKGIAGASRTERPKAYMIAERN